MSNTTSNVNFVTTPNYQHLIPRFKLVFVLDLRRFGDKSVAQAILEQCLEGAKRTASEINSIVKSHQNEVLFLLDGFEVIMIFFSLFLLFNESIIC